MINLLGLCKNLRDNFPIPSNPDEIKQAVFKYLGHEAPEDAQMDIVKALSAKWKRGGWFWDGPGAVKLLEGESAFFHQNGLSIVTEHEDNPTMVRIQLVEFGKRHPRVVWF